MRTSTERQMHDTHPVVAANIDQVLGINEKVISPKASLFCLSLIRATQSDESEPPIYSDPEHNHFINTKHYPTQFTLT